jgi:hypothetical protein
MTYQERAAPARKKHHWWRWVSGGAGAVVVVGVGVTFAYVHLLGGPVPAPLALPEPQGPPAGMVGTSVDGTWTVGTGSLAGYRVREDFLGPGNSLVGRTSAVTGEVVVVHGDVTSASFSVDLATVKSNGKLQPGFATTLGTAKYPDASFNLSAKIVPGRPPVINKAFQLKATGGLVMHGTAYPVNFDITARDNGAVLEGAGSVPVVFSNWDLKAPSILEDHGAVEFLLVMHR